MPPRRKSVVATKSPKATTASLKPSPSSDEKTVKAKAKTKTNTKATMPKAATPKAAAPAIQPAAHPIPIVRLFVPSSTHSAIGVVIDKVVSADNGRQWQTMAEQWLW